MISKLRLALVTLAVPVGLLAGPVSTAHAAPIPTRVASVHEANPSFYDCWYGEVIIRKRKVEFTSPPIFRYELQVDGYLHCHARPRQFDAQVMIQQRKRKDAHWKYVKFSKVYHIPPHPDGSARDYILDMACRSGYFRGGLGVWGYSSGGTYQPEVIKWSKELRVGSCKVARTVFKIAG